MDKRLAAGDERERRTLGRARFWIGVFIAGLFVSGVTAFPLQSEVGWVARVAGASGVAPVALVEWLQRVYTALADENTRYPFLAYGTDWLAFAHLVLAMLFVGPWRAPVRNRWVLEFGFLACAGFCR